MHEILMETTDWDFPNHTYLVSNGKLIAYLNVLTNEVKKLKGNAYFDKRNREFKKVKNAKLEKLMVKQDDVEPSIQIKSDSGKTYTITKKEGKYLSCTCPGFTYRGYCKHTDKVKKEKLL